MYLAPALPPAQLLGDDALTDQQRRYRLAASSGCSLHAMASTFCFCPAPPHIEKLISRYERGEMTSSIANVIKLATLLGTTVGMDG